MRNQRTATCIYLPGDTCPRKVEDGKPWAIGYNHRELLTEFRFKSWEEARQFGEIYCRNQAIPFVQ